MYRGNPKDMPKTGNANSKRKEWRSPNEVKQKDISWKYSVQFYN